MTISAWFQKTVSLPGLAKIPEHWNILPLRAVAKEHFEKNDDGRESNLLSLSYGKIVRKDIASKDGLLPESFDTYQIIEPSTIVLRLTDLQNDKKSLRVGYATERGIITSAYLAVTPKNVNPRYLYYLLHAYDVMKVFYGLGGGVRQSIGYDDLKWLPLSIPPLKTQVEICELLDREGATAERLATKYTELINLLETRRLSVVRRAVVRGVNPVARLKNSGIEWIGDIPEDWRTISVRRVAAKVETGGTPDDSAFAPEGVPWYTPGCFGMGIDIGDAERYVNPALISKHNLRIFERDSVLVVGIGATLGKVAVSAERCTSNQQINAVSMNSRMLPRYFAYSLYAFADVLKAFASSATLPILNQTRLKDIMVPYPSIERQREIISALDTECCRIGALIKRTQDAIKLVKERHFARIVSAILGNVETTNDKGDLHEAIS